LAFAAVQTIVVPKQQKLQTQNQYIKRI